MNLPENIVNALEASKLTTEHPLFFQIFEFIPDGPGSVLGLVSKEKYKNVNEAHVAAATLIKEHPRKYLSLTYLPIIE